MCRLLGYCSRSEASLENIIGADGLSAFTGLCALHGDGWGMAWYEGDEPVIRKFFIDTIGQFSELTGKERGR